MYKLRRNADILYRGFIGTVKIRIVRVSLDQGRGDWHGNDHKIMYSGNHD